MNGSQESTAPERTTLVLARDVSAFLDSQRAQMRRTTGTVMSRSELVRAIVRAVADLAVSDFSRCRNAEDIGLVMFCGELEDRPAPTSQGRGV